MLRKFFCGFTFIFLNLCYFSVPAQEILKKEKIYTLNTNEVIAYEENSLGLSQDEFGYIVVTADVKELTRYYHIKGKIYGPFNRKEYEKPIFNMESWGFIDSRGDTSYVFYNGREIGKHLTPYYPVSLRVAKNTWAYILIDQHEGTQKLIINGKEIGNYSYLQSYQMSQDGNRWAVIYSTKPEEFYVEFNDGRKLGPYAAVLDFAFLEANEKWIMIVQQKQTPLKKVTSEASGSTVEVPQITVINTYREVGTFEKVWLKDSQYKPDLMTRGANYGLNVIKDQKVYYLANDELYGAYTDLVTGVSMGKKYNQFNYIVKKNKELRFKGDGVFARNVDNFAVSDSRNTVAIIKKATLNKDSLIINNKYFKGIYNKIIYLKFAPNSEEWCSLNQNLDGSYSLNFSNGSTFGPFEHANIKEQPLLLLGKDCKNWALKYVNRSDNQLKLVINGKERKEEFVGDVAITQEDGEEYFSWFSLENRTVYLNKLLLK
ncbi:MAG: hypothetical protein NZ551_10150 [Microscillaceae bacterium]|nr:hypothetical protein [Microscillaceae bacterium]MDW8461558.1 hypothetical protein [Cytophagales bacterium]